MQIQFKNTDGALVPELQELVEQKLLKLSMLADAPGSPANAVFSLERSVGAQHTGDVWEASITIDSNGTRFYTSELADAPRKASEKVVKEIRTELKKARGKQQALLKREGSFWKRFQERFRAER